ncbi:hypothetical protein [Amycolatopsis albispora]|nr:hypothetical protein [Amycolatopsis albispora]
MSTFGEHTETTTGGLDRRRFLTAAAATAATGGVVALGLFGTSTARAATQVGGLPPIGAEIPCSTLALNTPLRLRDTLVSVDFKGGIKFRVEFNPEDPYNSVRLRVIGFRAAAELPETEGGTVTLDQEDVDVDAKSLLTLKNRFPPRYEQTTVLNFTMTVDTGARTHEPLVLTTKEPAQLIGRLTQFPPRGDLYRLQNPVDLVLPDNPDTTIATIERFPVKIGGL